MPASLLVRCMISQPNRSATDIRKRFGRPKTARGRKPFGGLKPPGGQNPFGDQSKTLSLTDRKLYSTVTEYGSSGDRKPFDHRKHILCPKIVGRPKNVRWSKPFDDRKHMLHPGTVERPKDGVPYGDQSFPTTYRFGGGKPFGDCKQIDF